ncbi:hypothetical protein ACWC9Q_36170 [Streptomyces sp. NPDC001142]
MAWPEPVRWRAHHEGCGPGRAGIHYRVFSVKLRTRADLLDWTSHLMEKNGLPVTV